MFPRKQRINKKTLKLVMRRGRGAQARILRVKWTPEANGSTKIAVVAGLAVDKRATARNLVKRRVREIAKVFLPKLKVPGNIVITAQKGAAEQTFVHLKAELADLLKRSGLI